MVKHILNLLISVIIMYILWKIPLTMFSNWIFSIYGSVFNFITILLVVIAGIISLLFGHIIAKRITERSEV